MEAPPLKTWHSSTGYNGSYNAGYDFGGACGHAEVEVVFRNHSNRLIRLIDSRTSGFIFCAVAWFTNYSILDALAKAVRRGVFVAVVVQKEDFLRPDGCSPPSYFKKTIRRKYDALGKVEMMDKGHLIIAHYATDAIGDDFNGCIEDHELGKSFVPVVRCVGNHNSDKSPSFSRMHHKFFVFGDINLKQDLFEIHCLDDFPGYEDPQARKVWTGSFNASKAACYSFENAVIIDSDEAATKYAQEFALMFMISEPLDWTNDWISPSFTYMT